MARSPTGSRLRRAGVAVAGAVALAAGLLSLSAPLFAAYESGYIGTRSTAIWRFDFDTDTGAFSNVREAANAAGPSFLVRHPSGRFLYAVNEKGPPAEVNRITAFALRDDAGAGVALAALGTVPSMGSGPCHLSIDASGRWLFVANYGSGSIAVYPVRADGRIGAAKHTVEQPKEPRPHAHQVLLSPDEHHLLSVDLGLDRVSIYRFDDASGALRTEGRTPLALPAGSGPRHLLFAHDARHVYLLNEHSAQLVTWRWDAARGAATQVAALPTLPPDFSGRRAAAELALSADGRFLYASNRGDANSIAAFRLDDGVPVALGFTDAGGRTPRYIGVDPSGRFLIATNQDSNTLVAFRIDAASGALTRVPGEASVPSPVHLVFAESAR